MTLRGHTDYIFLSGLVLGTGCYQLQLNKHLCEMFFCVFMPAYSIWLFTELRCRQIAFAFMIGNLPPLSLWLVSTCYAILFLRFLLSVWREKKKLKFGFKCD